MSEFSEGDVVRIRSGGPPMTVVQAEAGDFKLEAICCWWDEQHNVIRTEKVWIAALIRVGERKRGEA